MRPVSLDAAALCCPLIGVPDGGIHPHWIVVRVGGTVYLVVLDLPVQLVINKESAAQKNIQLYDYYHRIE
jgi:hypothetical protein